MYKIKNKALIIPIITLILSLIAIVTLNITTTNHTYKPYVSFLKDINTNNISIVYNTATPKINVKLKDGAIYETDNPRTNDFKEQLLKNNIEVSEQPLANYKQAVAVSIFIASIICLIVLLVKSSKIASKNMLSVDSLDANATSCLGVGFDNVAGNEEAKESVSDIVDFLKNPGKYTSYGARMPKGMILYGEPGTGKTLLAKAMAGEAGVPFYAVSGSDFIQIYVGVGASRIRQLFKKARSHGKAVIFIDEIDAIGKKRDNSSGGGAEERDQTLNALLTEMSGFNETEGIMVIAATNRLDMLDEALLRPGRFDRHIEIMLPDLSAREKILSLHFKNKPIGVIDTKEWAQKTSYFSGAKIESLVNEAAILACKENSSYIEDEHLDKAYSIVLAGYEKQNRSHIKENDRKITAYHEAGHALVSMLMLPLDKVSKVTIIPSTKGAGGYTLSIPEDSLYQNKDYLTKKIMVLLGGRAAEEIIFGDTLITTGAHNDLKQCTKIVLNMVTQFGMGKTLGLLNLSELSQLNLNKNEVVLECKELTNEIYEQVKQTLCNNKNKLQEITELLLEKETIVYEDLQLILNK